MDRAHIRVLVSGISYFVTGLARKDEKGARAGAECGRAHSTEKFGYSNRFGDIP
jgi:hypothetical protein